MLLVVSAAAAAHQVVGPRGVRWAALVAAAFVVTPVVMAQEADGELFAAPLVMLSMALTLAAVRRRGRSAFGTAVLAGAAAGAAVMVKQNFGDAVVFAVALLLALLLQRRVAPRDAGVVAAGGVLGGGLVVAVALAYVAWSRVGLAMAWTAVFGFRGTALDVIEDHSLHASLCAQAPSPVSRCCAGRCRCWRRWPPRCSAAGSEGRPSRGRSGRRRRSRW